MIEPDTNPDSKQNDKHGAPKILGYAAAGAWLGISLPDFDLLVLPILHHRSIVTHSALVAFIMRRWLSDPAYAGMLAGISVHLWADSLSVTHGFAQIYLPVITVGIGPALTFVWLVANSVLCFWLAIRIYRDILKWAIVAYLALALLYAAFNEGFVFLIYVLSVAGLLLFLRFRSKGGRIFGNRKSAKNEQARN